MSIPIFTISDFKHLCWTSNIHRIIKMQISIFVEITSRLYVIRLTHIIFAACNRVEHSEKNRENRSIRSRDTLAQHNLKKLT